jgi:hypothetical protein
MPGFYAVTTTARKGRNMKMSQAFPSKYLKADDLQNRQVQVVMSHVDMEDVGGDDGDKPVLYFQGAKKGVVLNRTNAAVIGHSYGDDTELWRGKPLLLYSEMVNFKGKMTPGIRCRVPAPAVPSGLAQEQPRGHVVHTLLPTAPPVFTEINPPPHDAMDDEIPF